MFIEDQSEEAICTSIKTYRKKAKLLDSLALPHCRDSGPSENPSILGLSTQALYRTMVSKTLTPPILMPKPPRERSLVALRQMVADVEYPFADDLPLVYLGDIPNMPGHCVVAGTRSGRIYSGYHIDTFIEVDEEDT